MRGMDHSTLRKALRLLVHPAALAAIALLLLNDHLLRRLWPSPVTDKLGDFAWLFFMPFAVTAVFAACWPGRGPRRSRALPVLAFGGVAAVFALAKTLPAAHATVVRLASAAFGFEVGWRHDPSDLIALVALGLAAWLWRRTPTPAPRASNLRSAGWVALGLAALLTVANSPAPEPGIYCLEARDGELMAYAGYSAHRSVDGGLTWATLPSGPRGGCPNPWSNASGAMVTVEDPAEPQRAYRYTPGGPIEISEDGGASWQPSYEPATTTEAMRARTSREHPNMMFRPAPLDGAVDRVTGNAVFAMGQAGVLVREAGAGAWREAPVGEFKPATASGAGDALSLLLGEALLALAAALLALAVFATPILARGKALWIVALVAGWGIWTVTLFVFSPALAAGYGAAFGYIALLALAALLLVTTIVALVGFAQHGRAALGRALLISAAVALLFFVPFIFWATNALPRYLLAAAFGTALAVAAIIAGSRWVFAALPRPAPAADAAE